MHASLMRGSRRGPGKKIQRPPPPISPASAAITILLCSTPPLHPLIAEKHRIRIWVFSGIYNPSRMTLYGAHVISLNVITPYNALSRRFNE